MTEKRQAVHNDSCRGSGFQDGAPLSALEVDHGDCMRRPDHRTRRTNIRGRLAW